MPAPPLLAVLVFFSLFGCASPSNYDRMEAKIASARPSADTYSSDLIFMGQGLPPDRPNTHWDFFYKDCEIARRNRALSRNEWECTEP